MGEDEMHVGPVITRREAEVALASAGYEPGTPAWQDALRRNYLPVEGRRGYTESDTFDLVPPTQSTA